MGCTYSLINTNVEFGQYIMSFLLPLAQTVVFRLINDRRVKELVIQLLEAYVAKTDNDIDDTIVSVVKDALLK